MYQQELISSVLNINPAASNCGDLLHEITEKYPYFSVGHFFSLQFAGANHPGHKKIAAKTALHFASPHFLNFRLNQVDKIKVIEKIVEVSSSESVPDIAQKEEMLFEPLSATDYFASQGIKLSEDVQTGDKLGKQLKSFTEWLKTMKKVHGHKLPDGSEQVDLAVQKLAEKSNQEDIILTESMAEAYVLQGKNAKARDIYEKLSLLNPSKNVYFAAKIESLKTIKQQVSD